MRRSLILILTVALTAVSATSVLAQRDTYPRASDERVQNSRQPPRRDYREEQRYRGGQRSVPSEGQMQSVLAERAYNLDDGGRPEYQRDYVPQQDNRFNNQSVQYSSQNNGQNNNQRNDHYSNRRQPPQNNQRRSSPGRRYRPVSYQQDNGSKFPTDVAPRAPFQPTVNDPIVSQAPNVPYGQDNRSIQPIANGSSHGYPPEGHGQDCGCSSCSNGYSNSGYNDGCDTGCNVGGNHRYDRYFRSGYDSIGGRRRGCQSGLCGGCSSCRSGRQNRGRYAQGGRRSRGGRRSLGGRQQTGCNIQGCNDVGCNGSCGSNTYEDRFYGSNSAEYFNDGSDCDSQGGYDLDGGCDTGGNIHTIVGGSWLLLERDGADFYPLSYENPTPSNRMLVGSADQSAQNGFEVFFSRQRECGNGWEARYWGLSENESTYTLGNMPRTELNSISTLNFLGATDLYTLYNAANVHTLRRDSQLHNVELNVLKYASGCGPSGRFVLRAAGGFRLIRFDDEFQYTAQSPTNFGWTFNRIDYNIDTSNTVIGAQLGSTGEYCVSSRVRLSFGAKGGIGANLISVNQNIRNSNGQIARNSHGNDFSYDIDDSDLAFFGELNTSLIYHVSDCFRVRFGYRAFGLTGVALTHQQIPYDFSDPAELNSVKRDGSLFYHGLQLRGEYCF